MRTLQDAVKRPDHLLRHMPTWSIDEIMNCRQHIFSGQSDNFEDAVRDRFSRWGGIPRWVLQNTDEEDQMLLTKALAECSISELVCSINNLSSAPKASHRLLHMTVKQNYTEGPVRFASQWVEEQAITQYLQSKQHEVHDFMAASGGEPTVADFRGKLWERFAHRKLQSGGRFLCRDLSDCGSDFELDLPQCDTAVSIWDHTEIAELEDAVYAWGRSKTFPAVDAVIQPDKLFQITVSDNHRINVQGLNNASQAMHGFPHVTLYFVVPPDMFSSYKKQALKRIRNDLEGAQLARDIKQCVLKLDFD
jgi:hypothetical protein